MKLKLNHLNYENHDFIWEDLKSKLKESFKVNITITFPEEWNNYYYNWFQDIENSAFRKELRYSLKEVKGKLENKKSFLFFILFERDPEAVILGYSITIDSKKVFLLDTIAIKHQKMGIGKILINYLIEWLKLENYKGINLNTEEINEKKFSLQEFYKQLGFKVRNKENNGNIDMILWF